MRDGCNFDLLKCFKDGKPLILDGTHVDPSAFLESVTNEKTGEKELKILTQFTKPPKLNDESLTKDADECEVED